MFGLSRMPASGASLLLNAEGVFTALLAWFVFKENFDRRIALGMVAIIAGALVLSWPGEARIGEAWPALAVLGACAAWAVDNNLTRKVALADATWIASIKGLVAGSVNLALGLAVGASLPPLPWLAGALLVGLVPAAAAITLLPVVFSVRAARSLIVDAEHPSRLIPPIRDTIAAANLSGVLLAVGLGASRLFS